jgi:hypothetical protein
MKIIRFFTIALMGILMNSCVVLKEPTVVKNDRIESYKYVFIPPTNNSNSGTGKLFVGDHGAYSSIRNKSTNPSDVIRGILIKEGFISLPELKPELMDQTLIVNYGESGKRDTGLGYAIEITIQFISAKSDTLVSSCTAEGQSETEGDDDIRQAITRCLSALSAK